MQNKRINIFKLFITLFNHLNVFINLLKIQNVLVNFVFKNIVD